jgi:hypothetical protein
LYYHRLQACDDNFDDVDDDKLFITLVVLPQASGLPLNLGTLEVHYKATLWAEQLHLVSNDILLRPGSSLIATGKGYGPGQGPGAGVNVSGQHFQDSP